MTGLRRVEPELAGDTFILTPFAERHLQDPQYVSWLRDPAVVETLNLPRYLSGAVTQDEIRKYCRHQMAAETVWFYAIELAEGHGFVGTLKIGSINLYAGHADLGIMVGRRDLWGSGIASRTLSRVAEHLFSDLGLRRLTAGAMATNPAMIRVFEKLGFQREGTFREHDRIGDRYVDHIHLGCLRQEFRPLR